MKQQYKNTISRELFVRANTIVSAVLSSDIYLPYLARNDLHVKKMFQCIIDFHLTVIFSLCRTVGICMAAVCQISIHALFVLILKYTEDYFV